MEKWLDGDKKAVGAQVRNIRNENFSADWLPKYDGLRACLVNMYFKYLKRWGKPGAHKVKIPTMITGDGLQPGLSNITCYGCGLRGHIRGSAECKAGSNAVWSGAPEGWRKAQANRGHRGNDGGGGRGKGKGGGGKGNGAGGKEKGRGLCHSFSTGSSYCRYGDNCKFLHTGKPAGGGGGRGDRGLGRGEKRKRDGKGGRGDSRGKSVWTDRKMAKKISTMVT